MNHPLLALDFDGVLCDSSAECAIVSANARLTLLEPDRRPVFSLAAASPEDFQRFTAFRYLVRTAAQYLLLWDQLDAGSPIHPTLPLERQTPADPRRLAAFQTLFYQIRRGWRESDYHSWLTHNPIHPAVDSSLDALGHVPDLRIVSAKDEESIRSILARHGLELERNQVLGREYGDKREVLARIATEFPGRDICFVDDNIDNIALAAMPGVRCLLADWGYVGPDWADRTVAAGHEVITPEGFARLVREARQ
jgi:phosphoglycolate phosphatase-like HAD superfamily hydrolase